MRFFRASSFVALSLMYAFLLSACGGGGSDTPAPPPLAPTVVTSSANTPSIDNVLINGSVNPNGLATTAWFEFGTDASLSTFTKTADQSLLAGSNSTTINATITGLTAGTKYYYRVAASSSAGTSRGAIDNVTTLSPPPTTNTTAADTITINSAVLRGEVNPNGLSTTAWFEYGQDSNLSSFTKTSDQPIGSVKIPVAVSQSISGLTPGNTYYYRVAASSTGGAPKGAIKSFITSPNPPPVANAGVDNSTVMGQSVTLNGSGSSDGGNGGTITYLWTQVAGTTVTLSGSTTANPTFIAPAVPYPGDNLVFQLTVTSSRGPSASDNVQVSDRWGFIDNFSSNTLGDYTVTQTTGTGGTVTYDAAGQRLQVTASIDNGVMFSRSLPASNRGVFSVDFSPTVPYPSHAGIWIRLMQDTANYFEVSNFDWFIVPPIGTPDLAFLRRVAGGLIVNEVSFPTGYTSGTTWPIKITYTPTQVTMDAFGQIINLPIGGSILVDSFEIELGKQDGYFDNIELKPTP